MTKASIQFLTDVRFGDTGWRVLDVAVAMAYAMLSSYGKQNRSLSAAAGVLRGYNSVYQLTDLEREHLPLLMACRLACSVTLGAYAIHMNPTNKYLLLHAEPAWKTLELIWGYDATSRVILADAARGLFNQACLYSNPREKIVTCYDLVIPDPCVADLLASVRVMRIESISEPIKKRRKTNGDGLLPTILLATGEHSHFLEVKRLLQSNTDDQAPSLKYHLEACEIASSTTEGDFIAVARSKCAAAVKETGSAVIVEVTGLCFNALNGLPGPYTQTFLDACGVLGLLKMVSAFDDQSAYARTVVCFCPGPGYDIVFFDGRSNGLVVPPRGGNGFSFDLIFQPSDGGDKTYAEMNLEEKDAVSHRARALSQLYSYLRKFRIEVASQL
jgi:inosine triphosphate pyrophosphatase